MFFLTLSQRSRGICDSNPTKWWILTKIRLQTEHKESYFQFIRFVAIYPLDSLVLSFFLCVSSWIHRLKTKWMTKKKPQKITKHVEKPRNLNESQKLKCIMKIDVVLSVSYWLYVTTNRYYPASYKNSKFLFSL